MRVAVERGYTKFEKFALDLGGETRLEDGPCKCASDVVSAQRTVWKGLDYLRDDGDRILRAENLIRE